MDDEISEFMKQTISKYELLKGKTKEVAADHFWDAVVISSLNEGQKVIFEAELQQMKEAGCLPLGIPFLVIADPPGIKIGNGGSTLHILRELQLQLGESMFAMRILLIHAGGFSQRLPSCSVAGKLFACLPVLDSTGLTVLDLLLATYLPLLPLLPAAGVFVCCSDALITFSIDLSHLNGAKPTGFLLLAHCSPSLQGTQHGVYVLPPATTTDTTASLQPCLRVLQKPSLQLMHECEATFLNGEGVEMAYTDSCFFFDADITKLLLGFYSRHSPLPCELDAYRDFLQPLGSQRSLGFISSEPSLRQLQRELCDVLAEAPAQTLVLHRSYFHHLGTMREYIQALSQNSAFLRQLGLSFPEQSVMQSVVSPASKLSATTVVEHCLLFTPVETEGNTILSNLYLSLTGDTSPISVPAHCLLHTIAIQWEDSLSFVTVGFGVDDDIKASSADLGSLCYLGMSFDQAGGPDVLGCSSYDDLNPQKHPSSSLWTLALFEVCPSRESSLLATLTAMNNFLKKFPAQVRTPVHKRASMEQCLSARDVTEHIRHKHSEVQKKDF